VRLGPQRELVVAAGRDAQSAFARGVGSARLEFERDAFRVGVGVKVTVEKGSRKGRGERVEGRGERGSMRLHQASVVRVRDATREVTKRARPR
jgi:hypothetical protein